MDEEEEVEDEVVVGEEGGVGEVRVAPVVLVAGEFQAGRLCPRGTVWERVLREVAGELAVGAALAYLVVQVWPRTGEGTTHPLSLEKRGEGGGEEGRWFRYLVSIPARI